MRAAQHTTRGPFRLLERRHGLTEIVERSVAALAEHPPVIRPHTETDFIAFSEDASRYGYRSAQQRLGFFEAL